MEFNPQDKLEKLKNEKIKLNEEEKTLKENIAFTSKLSKVREATKPILSELNNYVLTVNKGRTFLNFIGLTEESKTIKSQKDRINHIYNLLVNIAFYKPFGKIKEIEQYQFKHNINYNNIIKYIQNEIEDKDNHDNQLNEILRKFLIIDNVQSVLETYEENVTVQNLESKYYNSSSEKTNENVTKAIDDELKKQLKSVKERKKVIQNELNILEGRIKQENESNEIGLSSSEPVLSTKKPPSTEEMNRNFSLDEMLAKSQEIKKKEPIKKEYDSDSDEDLYKEDCKDKDCCPFKNSHITSSEQLRKTRLNEEISFAKQIIYSFGGIAIFLFSVVIFCIIRLITITRQYFQYKWLQRRRKSDLVERSGSSSQMFKNKENDDFRDQYQNQKDIKYAEEKNEFEKFQTGIDKSIQQYKAYNEKLKKASKNQTQNDGYVSGQIDKDILDREFDDW
jgi:hypothetical protein